MTTETVSGRSILRYRGEPVAHEIRFYALRAEASILARCPCGWSALLADGHSVADLVRLERQHAGLEDEDP